MAGVVSTISIYLQICCNVLNLERADCLDMLASHVLRAPFFQGGLHSYAMAVYNCQRFREKQRRESRKDIWTEKKKKTKHGCCMERYAI